MTRTAPQVTLWLAALLATGVLGCDGSEATSKARPVEPTFDAQRAHADLVAQVRIGPRVAGSEGGERARRHIRQRLRQAGWRVRDHAFTAQPPDREAVRMTNVIAQLSGARERQIVLAAHYDTKHLPAVDDFEGANDGASGVAVLLELARQLARAPRELDYQLWFFDGEEAFGSRIDGRDGLYGSRAWASQLRDRGELASIAAFVLIDMVGDADLNLSVAAGSSPRLVRLWMDAARALQLEHVMEPLPLHYIDDHQPFLEAGLEPVLALIDFQYGARWSPGPRWHGAGDTLDGVSVESLNSVGRLLVQFLERLEDELRLSEDATPG